MEREIETLNSNGKDNYVLIGDKNIKENAAEVLSNIKVRKNSVLARELLFTASPSFFKNLTQNKLDTWIDLNLQFIKENFNTVIYANLHLDELSPHIHMIFVPLNEKGLLSNCYYFDGIVKMKSWQDKYFEKMSKTFPQLERGTEKSKATHIEIQKFYSLVTKDLNELDQEQLLAKAKYSELLEMKIKGVEKTLEAYKKQNAKLKEENKQIALELTRSTQKTTLLQKTIDYMALIYKVSEKRLNEILDYVNGKDRGRER